MRDHDDPVAVLLLGVLCLVAAVAATVWAGAAVATLVAGNGLLGAGLPMPRGLRSPYQPT